MRTVLVLTLGAALAACGGAAEAPMDAPATTAVATAAAATATPLATEQAGAIVFRVAAGSQAIVRVREQLASLQAPSDAVLTSSAVSGSFTLNPDGTFASGSRIEVDLAALSSDSSQRDGYVKQNTLDTRQFPTATFVPLRIDGLALPLAEGDVSGTVVGAMTIRGVTREVAFEVSGRLQGGQLVVTATNAPAFKFADFEMQIPRVFSVLSIVDEIRLEVKLSAERA